MKIRVALTSLFLIVACAGQLAAAEYAQLPGAVHVHSTVSSGLYSVEDLVVMAKGMGLKVLVMTDQDLAAMEHGVFPFRNLIKKRIERNSILKLGPENYLSMISQVNQRQKDVVVVPGAQSSPFYYWTGNPSGENLTAHNYGKELLLIGMMSADDYRGLPLLHRGFSTQYFKELLPQSLILLFAFLLGIYLTLQRGYLKVAGIIVGLSSLVLLMNHHPFQSSRFDPYHGDQGIAPYQELIDYASAHGGLTFWAHPESKYSKSETKLGPIQIETMPYVDSLVESKNYNGFSAIYEDAASAADSGKMWDQLLNEYCSGRRSHPVWGIAGANFQGETDGVKLDRFQTVFITQSNSVLHIVEALSKGRVYARLKEKGGALALGDFTVEDAAEGEPAMMGAELNISSHPVVRATVTSADPVEHAVTVLLIKGGYVLQRFEGRTPLGFVFDDRTPWVNKSYYRLEVQGGAAGKLLSNPIFVNRKIALSAAGERSQKLEESGVDQAAVAGKAAAEAGGSDRKQEIYPGADALNIPKAPSLQPSAEKTISDKKGETVPGSGQPAQPPLTEPEKQGKAALPDTQQGRTPEAPGREWMITAIPLPYSVQVASLPSFDLAQKKMQEVQHIPLPVYHVKVDLGDKGIWWRLYVGYFATREAAMTARDTHRLLESIVQKTAYADLVGVYASLEEASAMRQRLEAMGYSPYVVRKSSDGYHLYVGAFITLKGAKDQQQTLKLNGIAAEAVKR